MGIVLVVCTALVAIGLQGFGPGLVTTRPSTAPPRETTTAQGTTISIVTGPVTVFHLTRILPLAVIGVAGLVCIVLSGRAETDAT